jgi:hypothetical protein
MSALRTTLASFAVLASLSSLVSAEVVRVPTATPVPVTVAPTHFAQPPLAPHQMRPPHQMRQPDDDLLAPAFDRAAVRAALETARHNNLDAFRLYQKTGVFPSNVYQPNALNVWRDQDGHFCAAATIIRMSGQTDLVDRVADQNNFIRLADVTQGPLMDWILTSGFTQEDIVAIQKPFMPVVEKPVAVPTEPMTVEARLRAKETARLKAIYKRVERDLVKNEQHDLDLAVDRLMKHPALAEKLVADNAEPASINTRRE